jgi:hypothetical protein
MALRKTLILRCLAERGLEGRTTPIQTIGNFMTVRTSARDVDRYDDAAGPARELA